MGNWRSFLAFAGVALTLVTVALGGWTGWQWMSQITVNEIRITGHAHTPDDDIRDLIQVDTGAVMFDINTALLEDRLVRHPWVLAAQVDRLPSGILDIELRERQPVAVLMGSNGRPAWWIDAAGMRLPMTGTESYDVPLIYTNLGPWHPMHPVEDDALRTLVRDLASLPPEQDALISEFVRSEEGWKLWITPIEPHGSLDALLGVDNVAGQMDKLQAFWEAQVLQHANQIFEGIDLRFDSRVNVRITPRPGYEPDSTNNSNE